MLHFLGPDINKVAEESIPKHCKLMLSRGYYDVTLSKFLKNFPRKDIKVLFSEISQEGGSESGIFSVSDDCLNFLGFSKKDIRRHCTRDDRHIPTHTRSYKGMTIKLTPETARVLHKKYFAEHTEKFFKMAQNYYQTTSEEERRQTPHFFPPPAVVEHARKLWVDIDKTLMRTTLDP